MADNVTLPGTGEAVASDDIGTVQYQIVKIALGALGTATALHAGAGVEANALRVADMTCPTSTVTSVASAATSAQMLASTAGRRGAMMFNDDANAVYVKFGTTASATDYTVQIPGGGYYEFPLPIYTGRVDAIWVADGSGSLRITEIT